MIAAQHSPMVAPHTSDTAPEADEVAAPWLERELRRGTLVLAVLAALRRPTGIYEMHKAMEKGPLQVRQSTLYLMVGRLTRQGLVSSIPGKGDKKLHHLTVSGAAALDDGAATWRELSGAIGSLLDRTIAPATRRTNAG